MNQKKNQMNVQFYSEMNQCYRSLEYLHESLAIAIEKGDIVREDYCFNRINLISDRIVELDILLKSNSN